MESEESGNEEGKKEDVTFFTFFITNDNFSSTLALSLPNLSCKSPTLGLLHCAAGATLSIP